MARTINGNYTGRAAATELREQRAWLFEQQSQAINPNSQYWVARFTTAITELLEHATLEALWDSELVPDNATYKRHCQMAEALLSYYRSIQLCDAYPAPYCDLITGAELLAGNNCPELELEGSDNTMSGQWQEHGYY